MRTLYLASVGLHLLAATVWIGSIAFFGLVLVPALRAPDLAPQRTRLLTVVGLRYRLVGWLSLAILLVTGLSNLRLRGVPWEALTAAAFWTSPWGRVLAWKLGLVTLLIAVHSLHDFVLGPRATRLLALDPGSEESACAGAGLHFGPKRARDFVGHPGLGGAVGSRFTLRGGRWGQILSSCGEGKNPGHQEARPARARGPESSWLEGALVDSRRSEPFATRRWMCSSSIA